MEHIESMDYSTLVTAANLLANKLKRHKVGTPNWKQCAAEYEVVLGQIRDRKVALQVA